MKLIDFLHFEPLNALKEKMGLSREVLGDLSVAVAPGRLTEAELKKLISSDGLEIPIEDLKVLNDGTLAYKNSRVLLYIRDVAIYGNGNFEPKYHLANCRTLIQMREDRRFEKRYVAATKTDGEFNLNLIRGNITSAKLTKLAVCQNCLMALSFNGFSENWNRGQRRGAVSAFMLDEFFVKFPKSLHMQSPMYTEANAPINGYTADFCEVSARAKRRVGHACEICRACLAAPEFRQYLQTHHKNAAKFDNDPRNLQVLCLACHAEQPAHQHMKRLPEYAAFLRIRAAPEFQVGKD